MGGLREFLCEGWVFHGRERRRKGEWISRWVGLVGAVGDAQEMNEGEIFFSLFKINTIFFIIMIFLF